MKKFKSWLRKVRKETWFTLAITVFVLLIWQITVGAGWVTSPFLPSPAFIINSAADMLAQGLLQQHVAATLGRLFAGFLAGTVAGLILGYVAGWFKTIRFLLDPIITVIYPIPKIAVLPLIMLLIGIGEQTMILIIALSAFFPVLINCIAGVLNINQAYFDLAKNYGARQRDIFTHVIVPGSLPMIGAGIRLGLGMSLVMTVVVELALANNGLGAMLWLSWSILQVERTYLAIFIIAVLSLVLNPLFKLIIAKLAPFQDEIS